MSGKLLASLLLVSALSLASARPYYFMFEKPENAPQAPQAPPAPQAPQVPNPVAEAGQQLQSAVNPPPGAAEQQLPKRIQGHLNQLYTHGSSGIKTVVDRVQPDLKNIGQDLSDAFIATKDNVGKRIEPLTQTVRPYLDHAHKVVAPYVNTAREEVPKLVTNVGEKVRDGLNGLVDKVKSGFQPPPPQQQPAQKVVDSVQAPANNAISQ